MDLLLDYGDLSIEKIEYDNQDIPYYDLVLESSIEQTVSKIIRRTLETPLGYIKKAIQDSNTIKSIDSDYGNSIYRKLSEPLTMSFVLEIQRDIEKSLEVIKDIQGLVFNNVRVNSFSLDTLKIEVDYTYNNQISNSQLVLSL